MGWKTILPIAALLLLSTNGCSYLFYPHAKEFTEKAKGTTGLETVINLTNMAEASANAAKGGTGVDQPFDDLHNQFHAINDSICCVEKSVRERPGYALAVTHNKELKAIFKRLWKFKGDQPQRDQHLNLLVSELTELRETLQTLR
ncbi:MAG: hypothetical protein OEV99_14505 [Nitrospira sp.]|nr:hypothetical protein [Nitrospira sp.]MDH4371033.1 hypothetical protein [Nitrospira sp.]MDH5346964.1 hypothetical protein [Nitrospira sp.]MDH5498384.1 hypothetical protein [Nitrospira sp.]MDH5724542.1 hypothetical protein [Nitrospira sp.]